MKPYLFFRLCIILLAGVNSFFTATAVASEGLFSLVRRIVDPAGNSQTGDEFGISVSWLLDRFVVGAYRADGAATDEGAAYIYSADGRLLSTIHNPNPTKDGFFGRSIAANGNSFLIGAEGNTAVLEENGKGRAFLFDASGVLQHSLDNPYRGKDAAFGRFVGLTNNRLLVSDVFHDELGFDSGAVHLFHRDGQFDRTIRNPDPNDSRGFGRGTIGQGNEFLISSGGDRHRAYLFSESGKLTLTLENPGSDSSNLFGVDLEFIGESTLGVGAFSDSSSGGGGGLYLFDRNGNVITEIRDPDPQRLEWFGRTLVAVGGSRLLVGSPFDNTQAPVTGAVYLYDLQGNLLQTLLHPQPFTQSHFGIDMDFNGDTLVVGAHSPPGFGTGPGQVFLYRLNLLPGDVDMNGVVNLLDFASLRTHFGQDVDARVDGDLTGDLHVDIHDFAELRANFNRRQAPVPEPGVLGGAIFLAVCALASLRGRCPILMSPRP